MNMTPKMKTTSKNEEDLKSEDGLKNGKDLKKKDDMLGLSQPIKVVTFGKLRTLQM